jgi:hypothetical protein
VTGAGQAPGLGPGGNDDAVEGLVGTVVEFEAVAGGVEGHGPVAEAQVESESIDLLGVAQADPVEVPGAGQ